ncbi:MAG: hypothetical protein E3K32_13340 [wastewater metagenome]|nr:hypothetical protein [Candidatus Loosdrechtia aerotolerans]
MSNSLMPFIFEGVGIRSLTKEDGSIWFVVKDVCEVLEIVNSRDAIAKLRDKDKDDVGLTDTIGRTQKMTIISEFGLYELVLSSRKENAQRFKYWICDEVIPSIRKTGTYGHRELTTMDMLETMFKQYREQETKRMEMERKLKAVEAKQEVFLKSTEYFTVLAYSRMIGVAISLDQAKRLGKKATALCREKGLPVDKARDPRFGMIGCYPEKVLDEVFQQEFSLC